MSRRNRENCMKIQVYIQKALRGLLDERRKIFKSLKIFTDNIQDPTVMRSGYITSFQLHQHARFGYIWVGWFSIRSLTHTHTEQEMDRCACTCTNMQKHHRGKRRQLLGIKYKRPHQTCRQTDDYLHDKDLKYSLQNVFPLELSHYFPCVPSVQAIWFWHKGYFSKGLREAGFDSTSARTERSSFFSGGGAEEQRGHIVVFPAENHLMHSRNSLLHWLSMHCSRLYVFTWTEMYYINLQRQINSHTDGDIFWT